MIVKFSNILICHTERVALYDGVVESIQIGAVCEVYAKLMSELMLMNYDLSKVIELISIYSLSSIIYMVVCVGMSSFIIHTEYLFSI